jgi:hypothetical protein
LTSEKDEGRLRELIAQAAFAHERLAGSYRTNLGEM